MKKPLESTMNLSTFVPTKQKIGIAIQIGIFLLVPLFSFTQTFFGVSSNPADGGNVVTATVAVTPPLSMAAGDLVIIYAHHKLNGATLSISATGGQTWATETAPVGANNQAFSIFWCRFNGTWGPNPSVTGGNGANPLSAIMYVYRPTISTNSWGIHMAASNVITASTATPTITGLTTTVPKTVTMAFWGSPAATTWNPALTSGGPLWIKTGLLNQYRNTGGTGQSHTAAYTIRAAAATVINVQQTQSAAQITRTSIISWAEITPPANDLCANAAVITTDSACVTGSSRLINQTLSGATADGGAIATTCTSVNSQDVWYQFVAKTKYPTITVSNLGSNWGTSLKIQLLSGSCGSFTEVACANNAAVTPAVANPLIPGNTYYIRIHKNNSTVPGAPNWLFDICVTDALTKAGRMKEVFSRTILSGAAVMNNPWEVTYGPDDKLWVTDSKNYRVYRIDPNTGARVTVLDISQFSATSPDNTFNCQFNNGAGAQGGLAGLALHPNFLNGLPSEKNYVYISYIFSMQTAALFTNRLVRFTYNVGTDRLISPVSICDSLPGSNDHNSQRMIIAPEVAGGTKYLFYASGDMGAGQGTAFNRARTINAQFPYSYEGKILRFNLEEDGDAVQTPATINYNRWIPNDNPYSAALGKQSAVWNIGQRNNQGFVYDTASHILYGSSHGAYSDDEINILERGRNYGHPLVLGFAADGNYNGTITASTITSISAGCPFPTNFGNSTCPPVGNEAANAVTINGNGNGAYKDPLFSGYPGPTGTGAGTVANIWATAPSNSTWPSEGWSGLDLYTNKVIPGWKQSLIASGLKWGRLLRLKLGSNGTTTLPSNLAYGNIGDTITYFQSANRYRDIAFGPNGKDIYVIMDNNAASVATDGNPPVTPACAGCLIKYSFLGYANIGGKSTIPTSVEVTDGIKDSCHEGTTITIDATNNNLWVPITGPDGNIMAEIKANSNNLGVVTSSFFIKSGPVRQRLYKRYLNRNITITPTTQPSTPVSIRLYLTKAEFDSLDADPVSGISAISDLRILKNGDVCEPLIATPTTLVAPAFMEAHGARGYMLQANINSFSSFYFGNEIITLPVEIVYFKGSLQNNATLLQWETVNENNTSLFDVERSIDGRNFERIGDVAANGNSAGPNQYSHIDNDVNNLSSLIIYYRLKMVDIDGQFKYSSIVTIYLADMTRRIVVSPNPAFDETKVIITATLNGNANWKLVDNSGRVVMQNAIYIKRGSNNFTINVRTLSAGLYFLKITGAGIDQHIKLQKL